MYALTLILAVTATPPLVPNRIPAWRDPGDYAGAAACKPCHAHAWWAWRRSPHGRAMAEPSADTVAGSFDAAPIPLQGGEGRPLWDAERGFRFALPGPDGQPYQWPVSLVLASGRTHQLYVTQTEDGRLRPLPIFWGAEKRRWASLQDYRPSSLDPESPDWWGRGSLLRYSCLDCHASQASYRLDGERRIVTEYVDLSVNCEACHGPAKAHAAGGPPPASLKHLSKEREARLCGQCHAYKIPFQFGVDELGIRRHAFQTPAYAGFRPDGTQGQTVYQMTGHLLSECYRKGAMTCSSCHAPHLGWARDLSGRPALGDQAHRQCTVCHRDLADPTPAAAHTGHPPGAASCTECHMGSSWILDTPATHQHTADHTISIPRPDEAALGGALSCLHCHDQRDAAWARAALAAWGSHKSAGPRPWVQAVSKGRNGDPAAVPMLVALLGDRDAGDHLHATALSLLEAAKPGAAVVPVLLPWADHPSAELRGYAVRALMHHDKDRAGDWRRRGASDPDAFVRLAAFGGERRLADLSAAEVRRAADDAAARALSPSEPVSVWVTAAKSHLRRGEAAQARPYLDAAARWATPEQARFHAIDRLQWLTEGARP